MPRNNKISKERKEFLKEFIELNNIETAEDIQDALKNMFKDTLQEMLEAELTGHLGYEKSEYTEKEKDNYRNRLFIKNSTFNSRRYKIRCAKR